MQRSLALALALALAFALAPALAFALAFALALALTLAFAAALAFATAFGWAPAPTLAATSAVALGSSLFFGFFLDGAVLSSAVLLQELPKPCELRARILTPCVDLKDGVEALLGSLEVAFGGQDFPQAKVHLRGLRINLQCSPVVLLRTREVAPQPQHRAQREAAVRIAGVDGDGGAVALLGALQVVRLLQDPAQLVERLHASGRYSEYGPVALLSTGVLLLLL
mmetsp:Transcript_64913/g.189919  ORF Transcript_64913/g.189919 Transcript_64913/m.189919 type:complete len:224 (+) Transcript_64913:310-981(+)